MASPATFLLSVKIFLITTGAVSIAAALKFSVPFIMGFCLYDVPVLWNSLLTWLRPPYLYFIANGIIITIVAASKFSHPNHQAAKVAPLITTRTPPPSEILVAAVPLAEEELPEAEEDKGEAEIVEVRAVVVNGIQQLEDGVDGEDDEDVAADDKWIVPKSDFTPSQEKIDLPVKDEKQLALSSFSHLSKSTPEGGRPVRVVARRQQNHHQEEEEEEQEEEEKEEEHDTLENTWKMITEGRHVPVASQVEISDDTWENNGREVVVNSLEHHHPGDVVTFRDRTNYNHGGTEGAPAPEKEIRKEASLSQEELNRRAEEFIKKFNEEMRLQRQESMKKFMEMINRGAN